MSEKQNIANMNSDQLHAHIDALEEKQKLLLKGLRALLKVRESEEDLEIKETTDDGEGN